MGKGRAKGDKGGKGSKVRAKVKFLQGLNRLRPVVKGLGPLSNKARLLGRVQAKVVFSRRAGSMARDSLRLISRAIAITVDAGDARLNTAEQSTTMTTTTFPGRRPTL